MAFWDFLKKVGSAIYDTVGTAVGKVSSVLRPITSKISDIAGGIRSGLSNLREMPVIGEAVRMLENTPVGGAISSGINKAADIAEYANQVVNG